MNNQTVLNHLMSQRIHANGAALTEEAKAALLTLKEKFLSELKVGDLLTGTLIKNESLFLELEAGLKLPVSLLEPMPVGEKMKWIVKNIDRQTIQISPQQTEKTSIVQKAVTELQLPQTTKMKEVIESFTAFELPLERTLLMQGYQLMQKTKLPGPVLLSLCESYGDTFAEAFSELKPAVTLKEVQVSLQDLAKGVTHEIKQNPVLGERLFKYFTLQESTEQLGENLKTKEQAPMRLEDVSDTKKIVKEHLIQQAFVKEDFIKEDFTKEKEVFSKWIGKQIETLLEVEAKGITKQSLKDSPLLRQAETLQSLVEEMEKATQSPSVQKNIEVLKEQIQVLNQTEQQGHFYQFILPLQQGKAEGELYFYKPKKKSKPFKKDLYTVVSLDLPSLKHLEIHIYQVDKKIDMTLYTQSEEIEKFLGKRIEKLKGQLIEEGYEVGKCTCQRAEKKKIQKTSNTYEEHLLQSFDFSI